MWHILFPASVNRTLSHHRLQNLPTESAPIFTTPSCICSTHIECLERTVKLPASAVVTGVKHLCFNWKNKKAFCPSEIVWLSFLFLEFEALLKSKKQNKYFSTDAHQIRISATKESRVRWQQLLFKFSSPVRHQCDSLYWSECRFPRWRAQEKKPTSGVRRSGSLGRFRSPAWVRCHSVL